MSNPERKTRYTLSLQVAYDDGENYMSGPVIDISETGLFIETVMPLEPGRKVRITPLVDEQAGIFEFEGEVVRANDYNLDDHFDRVPGMGVRFIEPDGEQIAQLKQLFNEVEAKNDAESKDAGDKDGDS